MLTVSDAPASRCESCGAPLPGAEAVCSACEPLLAQAIDDDARRLAPHRCPGCGGRFAVPGQQARPAGVLGALRQVPRPACPHCRAALRDRRQPELAPWQSGLPLLVVMVGGWWLPVAWFWLLAVSVLLVYGVFLWRRTERGVPDDERYQLDRPATR